MGKGKKSKKGKHSSRSRTDDVEGGAPSQGAKSSVMASLPKPLMVGLYGVEVVFGLVFIVVGALNIDKCNIDPMIPIWLILMGVVYMVAGVHEYVQYHLAKKNPYKERGAVPKVVTALLTVVIVGLFIAGNVFVYQAWGVEPDYGHYWFSNGCNKSAYILAFVGVIVMDALFGVLLLGVLFYAAFSCFSR